MSKKNENQNPLEEEFFVVEYPGDPSVGWPTSTYSIEGPFIFDSLEDKAAFMKGLYDAFAYLEDENRQVIPSSVCKAPDWPDAFPDKVFD